MKFYGRKDIDGKGKRHWLDAVEVKGKAVDFMVPGYNGGTVNTLRLWKTDMPKGFTTGNGEIDALIGRINDRLYPDDSNDFGKKLRLMQEYFFTSLSLQDIVRRHLAQHKTLDNLAETAAIQLNDTHPVIAVPELMRILVDENNIGWEKAKEITRQTCFYTNHTLLPEALEQWPEWMFRELFPRHIGIINGLNRDLMLEIDQKIPPSEQIVCKERATILKDGRIRMGQLAVFCTNKTNGVANHNIQVCGSNRGLSSTNSP